MVVLFSIESTTRQLH